MERRWDHIRKGILFCLSLHLLVLLLCFCLSACSSLQSTPSPPETKTSPRIFTGQKIPELNLLNTQGNSVSLYSLLGKAERTALVFYRGYW
jgi:hypothetical protein